MEASLSSKQKLETSSKILEKELNIRRSISTKYFTPEQMLEFAITILKKPLNIRNHQEIQMLMRCTEEVKFFQNLGQETHEQCCRNMLHKFMKADSVLFEIGKNETIFFNK